jgi:hypothetical protein
MMVTSHPLMLSATERQMQRDHDSLHPHSPAVRRPPFA